MRFFIEFSYNGSNYHGWQRQPSQTSIQERFEDCISKILSSNISLTAAGRTDTGVHAKKMFANDSRVIVEHSTFSNIKKLAEIVFKNRKKEFLKIYYPLFWNLFVFLLKIIPLNLLINLKKFFKL